MRERSRRESLYVGALADLITHRVSSHLWALDETAWQTDVQPVVDALRALTARTARGLRPDG